MSGRKRIIMKLCYQKVYTCIHIIWSCPCYKIFQDNILPKFFKKYRYYFNYHYSYFVATVFFACCTFRYQLSWSVNRKGNEFHTLYYRSNLGWYYLDVYFGPKDWTGQWIIMQYRIRQLAARLDWWKNINSLFCRHRLYLAVYWFFMPLFFLRVSKQFHEIFMR